MFAINNINKNKILLFTELILGCGIAGFMHNLLLWPQTVCVEITLNDEN